MLEMEGLMKEIKACTGRCNGDCKKKSKGSLGLEDYCNRVSFFETLFIIESRRK